MKTYNLANHNTIANKFIAELRDSAIQKDKMRFRRNLERIGEIFAYEISKTLEYKVTQVETPLGIADSCLPQGHLVLAPILRAGLPLHQGLLNYFDDADNAFVSAYRKHHKDGTFDIKLQYATSPNLDNCTLIVADPMIATGSSIHLAIKELLNHGTPKNIHIVSAIASNDGLAYVRRLYPKAYIWAGAIDEELTARSYIVPGLGDAGDLAFGKKITGEE